MAERFISGLIKIHGPNAVSTNDGGTWFPTSGLSVFETEASYSFLISEKYYWKNNTIKDRTECFDDYFPCRKKKCKIKHVSNWLNLFVGYHHKELFLK